MLAQKALNFIRWSNKKISSKCID